MNPEPCHASYHNENRNNTYFAETEIQVIQEKIYPKNFYWKSQFPIPMQEKIYISIEFLEKKPRSLMVDISFHYGDEFEISFRQKVETKSN